MNTNLLLDTDSIRKRLARLDDLPPIARQAALDDVLLILAEVDQRRDEVAMLRQTMTQFEGIEDALIEARAEIEALMQRWAA